jgi:hypothetical protein
MDFVADFPWVEVFTAAAVIATAVAAATPTDKDDGVVDRVVNILRKVGLVKPKE